MQRPTAEDFEDFTTILNSLNRQQTEYIDLLEKQNTQLQQDLRNSETHINILLNKNIILIQQLFKIKARYPEIEFEPSSTEE